MPDVTLRSTRITLSAAFARQVSEPGAYGDGRGGFGLLLRVRQMANGRLSKTWCQRVRLNGRPTHLSIGCYPLFTLAEARQAAQENLRAIPHGKDPRRHGSTLTFKEAAEKVIRLNEPNWKSESRTAEKRRSTLSLYAYPTLGDLPVSEVTTAHVLAAMTRIWTEKPQTAQTVLQRISQVMQWSIAKSHRHFRSALSRYREAASIDSQIRKLDVRGGKRH